MLIDNASLTTALLRKLEARDRVSDEERAVLETMISDVRIVEAGADIVSDGERPSRSTLVVDGIAMRYKLLSDGARQITALHLPGDFVDLHSFLLKEMDHGVGAVSACRVATVPHETLLEISREHPHLSRLFWFLTLLDGALHREWLVAMGRRPALSQMAHLLCELRVRFGVIGHLKGESFTLPITQLDLSDILGLSSVHVNRVLQELRGDGLVSWKGTLVTILDWPRLSQLAEFDDRYLHLSKEPR